MPQMTICQLEFISSLKGKSQFGLFLPLQGNYSIPANKLVFVSFFDTQENRNDRAHNDFASPVGRWQKPVSFNWTEVFYLPLRAASFFAMSLGGKRRDDHCFRDFEASFAKQFFTLKQNIALLLISENIFVSFLGGESKI